MRIPWEELEKNHNEFKLKLKGLDYEKKQLVIEYSNSLQKRKEINIAYKVLRKKVSSIIKSIKLVAVKIKAYRKSWVESGGTEDNFWLHQKANLAMVEFQQLSIEKDTYSIASLRALSKELSEANVKVNNISSAIRQNKSVYRSTQVSMDEHSTIKYINSLKINPNEAIAILVEFKKIKLSIRKHRQFRTNEVNIFIKSKKDRVWYKVDKNYKPISKCMLIEVKGIELAISKYDK